ncbi:MAG: hypothetical protein M0P47_01560 [Bacteroidales bacterium]|nr:hypothetical protein [Bacteroidales bacterium]
MKKLVLVSLLLLLSGYCGWGQVNIVNENIQNWTNQGSYGNYLQSIPVEGGSGNVVMTDCLIQNGASATGTCSAGRVQIKALTGKVEFPEISSIKTAEFHFAAGAAGRSVKLQKNDGAGGWVDLTTFTGIGTTGATFTFSINQNSAITLRLTSASNTVYLHDIIFNTQYFNSASSGSIELITSWGTKSNGTGTNPANFISSGQIFTIINNATPTIGADWIVSGAESKIVVGNGINSCAFSSGIHNITTQNLEIKTNASLTLNSDATGTGSLIVNGTVSGNITTQRYIPDGTYWHYVSAPVHGQTIDDSWMSANDIDKPSIAYQFFRFDEPLNYWIIYGSTGSPAAFGDGSFSDARGYILKRSSAGVVSFTGTVLPGPVEYMATLNSETGGGYNLVGNPFPSSIGITAAATSTENFLDINDAVLDPNYKALFIWDEQTGYSNKRDDYKIISNGELSGYTRIGQNYIQPGQAFMIKSASTDILRFTNGMRQHASEPYHKIGKSWSIFELGINGNNLGNTTMIGFHEGMTKGLDPSYDVGKLKGNPDIALYTRLIEDNGIDFAIQCLPPFMESYSIAIGIETTIPGEYVLESLNLSLPDSVGVYLEDLETKQIINFRTNSKYPFVISQAGVIDNRFLLHFIRVALGVQEKEQKIIHFYFWENKITIKMPEGNNSQINGQLRVLDISGKILINKSIEIFGKLSIPLYLPMGYYLVQIVTPGYSLNEKIFIHHK